MKKMTYQQLRDMWLGFLADKDHAIIPSAPIVPENDASTLFTTAGMQPLVPYLLGEVHPLGKRIANIQYCVRTNDIEEVGDDTHLTFFEMMGNWSLGDYFKKEKVAWSWELLTSDKYLGFPKDKIHVTCFEGDATAPRDEECAKYWEQQGVPRDRIHFLNKKENWWAMASGLGPQGPCSEMFYDRGIPLCGKDCNPSCNCGKFVEVGNDVYMQYVVETPGGAAKPAKLQCVDTGWGLERILCLVNGYKNVYESEVFAPAISIIESSINLPHLPNFSFASFTREARVIAEHTRAACGIIAEGVIPSNTGAGYVLRRMIRRAVRMAKKLGTPTDTFTKIIEFYNTYLAFDRDKVTKTFLEEVTKFEKTLQAGLKEFEKLKEISGKEAFHLYETYGFPVELTRELAAEKNLTINMDEYNAARDKHAAASAAASAAAGAFKGGLGDTGEQTTRYHTATHLLLATLREMFGNHIEQRGSNITPERLRFDFNIDRKLTAEEIAQIEKRINEIIVRDIPVTYQEMPTAEAKKLGAIATFGDRYGDRVKVYSIGSGKNVASLEICGGPHVTKTGELGTFKIQKEESVAAGIRRIKAVLS